MDTGPESAWVRRGDVALAEPTIVFAGQVPAVKFAIGQWFARATVSAPTPCGSTTSTLRTPASPLSCSTTVVRGGLLGGESWPGDPMLDRKVGEKSRAAQPVGGNPAGPVGVGEAESVASKVVVAGVQDVGLRMNGFCGL